MNVLEDRTKRMLVLAIEGDIHCYNGFVKVFFEIMVIESCLGGQIANPTPISSFSPFG